MTDRSILYTLRLQVFTAFAISYTVFESQSRGQEGTRQFVEGQYFDDSFRSVGRCLAQDGWHRNHE